MSLAPVHAATAAGETFSIRLEMDLPSESAGPRVFEVLNVTPGAGAELDINDEVSNPSDWCGSLSVDIEPSTRTVTIGPGPDDESFCFFESVRLVVTSAQVPSLTYTDGRLLNQDDSMVLGEARAPEPNPTDFSRVVSPTAGGAQVLWTANSETVLYPNGTETFTYTVPAPAPAPTPTPTPTPTPAPAKPTAFTATPAPAAAGKAQVGKKVKVVNAQTTSFVPTASKVKIQWFRGKAKIKGAKKASYKVTRADLGQKLKAKIKVSGSVPTKTYTVKTKKVTG